MNESLNPEATGNEKVFRFISFMLVFLMMACLAMAIGVLIRTKIPGWSSGIISGILLLVVIDRLYTYERLKSLIQFSREWAITLGAQWVIIVLFIRTFLSFAGGFDSFIGEMSSFARGNLAALFSLEFIATVLLAGLVWYLPGRFLELLDEIGLDWALISRAGSALIPMNAMPAHQRLVNLTFQAGIGLVILTALTRVNFNALNPAMDVENYGVPLVDLSRLSGAEAATLLYFIAGLALLSLGRLMSLQTRWRQDHIPVASSNLAGQWGMYSFFFLFILIVMAGLLSSGENHGLLSLLGTLVNFLIYIYLLIGRSILLLFALLLRLYFLLLGKEAPVQDELPALPPRPEEDPQVELLPAATNYPILALIRSIVLWGSLIVIVGLSVVRYVRQHDGLLTALRKAPVVSWIILVWQWLSRNVDETRGNLSRVIADGWKNIVSRLEGRRNPPRPGFISLRTLDPRRQIYFFYLAMVRRGGDQGVERLPSQTPSEYAVTLESALPTQNEDVRSITESFIEARYSPHDIDSQKANLVKAAWNRVRQAFQKLGILTRTKPGEK